MDNSYYKNRYGITKIRKGKFDNLMISWDSESDENDKDTRYPVFLYTPNMNDKMDHYHIELNKKQAEKLRDWLTCYLEDK